MAFDPNLDTLPKLLLHNAENFGSETALREKTFGIWKSQTWEDYNRNAKRIAAGLSTLGVANDDVVALIGDNRPDWVAGEVAIHSLGAISIGLYRDLMEDELAYLIEYSQAKVVLAEDEEQVDKFLNLSDRLTSLEYIVYEDPRGMRKYEDSKLISLEELRKKGDPLLQHNQNWYENKVAETDGEKLAILCTTSGTTSHPKLAMISAAALVRHCHDYLSVAPMEETDEYVSNLPLPWIMEQIYALGKSLISRMTVNFVEEGETLMSDFREIGPNFVLFAPRVWEQIAADVHSRMMDSSWINQKLYNWLSKRGMKAFEAGKTDWLAQKFLYDQLKDRLGLTNVKSAATGGAALGPDTFKFFLAMGVPLRQLYGQTELMGAYTIHEKDDVDFDTVGIPFTDDIKVSIKDPDEEGIGEIISENRNRFMGYYKNEDATAEDLRDGIMYTGDAGYYNDAGHLVVIDRIADLAVMSSGLKFSPQFIENKLKFCPYIGEAVILGAGRDYLAAMVCIRYSIVSKWAEKNRISFTTYTDLSAREEVYKLLRKELLEINKTLPKAQQIKKFVLLYKELDPDDGELTRTRKVRRSVINEKYGEIIDTIYSDQSHVDIDTTITFQDGTKQRIQTTLEVENLAGSGDQIMQAAE